MARGSHRHKAAQHQHASQHAGHHAAPATTQEERDALLRLVEQVPTLATELRSAGGTDLSRAREVLAPIFQANERVARDLAAHLGGVRGEHASDAAEVAQALATLETRREVVREARRAGIRLHSVGATVTATYATAKPAPISALTRYVRGARPPLLEAHCSLERETGTLTLLLGWQDGFDRSHVRGFVCMLDFAHVGITEYQPFGGIPRQNFKDELMPVFQEEEGMQFAPITWAQARRLMSEALAVAAWRGVTPPDFYQAQQSFVSRVLLSEQVNETERAAIEEERQRAAKEGDRPWLTPDLEEDLVVGNFVGCWTHGDYGLAYDLLADEHPLRAAQSRDEFIALRRQWASEADPVGLYMSAIAEYTPPTKQLWLPRILAPKHHEAHIEAHWTMRAIATPLSGQLDEMPFAVGQDALLHRHWYWTRYTLRREGNPPYWRIIAIEDEGLAAQALAPQELRARLDAARKEAETLGQHVPATPELTNVSPETLRYIAARLRAAALGEALLARQPDDEQLYQDAAADALEGGDYIREAATLARAHARFPERVALEHRFGEAALRASVRADQLHFEEEADLWSDRSIAALEHVVEQDGSAEHMRSLALSYLHEDLDADEPFARGEATLRSALERDPSSVSARMLLVTVLMDDDEDSELPSIGAVTDPTQRARLQEALQHLHIIQSADPDDVETFKVIADVYEKLGQMDDMKLALDEMLRRKPDDPSAHHELARHYLLTGDLASAYAHFQRVAEASPESAVPHLGMAACHCAMDRFVQALAECDTAERLAPSDPRVAAMRVTIEQAMRGEI